MDIIGNDKNKTFLLEKITYEIWLGFVYKYSVFIGRYTIYTIF